MCPGADRIWLETLSAWANLVRRFGIRLTAPEDLWTHLPSDGCPPNVPTIRANLSPSIHPSSVPSVIVLLGNIASACDPAERSAVITGGWTTTGCLSAMTCTTLTREIAAILLEDDGSFLAGSLVDEDEVAEATALVEAGGLLMEETISAPFRCLSRPATYLAGLDTNEFVRASVAGVLVESEAVVRSGGPGAVCTFACLTELEESLVSLTEAPLVRAAFRAMASLLRAPVNRNNALDERPLRVSAAPDSPPRVSDLGSAYRATVSDAGPGWRLHYWRRGSHVVFANVVQKDSLVIAQGPEAAEGWPTTLLDA